MNQLLKDCLNQVNPDTRAEVRKNMTMTRELDERARDFAKKQCDKYGDEEEIFSFYYNEYLEIAEEQKAIDDKELQSYVEMTAKEAKQVMIDKATEWFANYLFEIGYPDDWVRDNGTWMNGAARFIKEMKDWL